MIEIELFECQDNCSDMHTLNIWINGDLACANEIYPSEILELRNALHNELLWMNDYLREKGLE